MANRKNDLSRAFAAYNAVARFGRTGVFSKAEHDLLKTIAIRIDTNDVARVGRESLARDSGLSVSTVSRSLSVANS